MKIMKITQTYFITNDNTNRIWIELDEFISGSTINLSGRSFEINDVKVTSKRVEAFIPNVEKDENMVAALKLPDGRMTLFTCIIRHIKKWRISFVDSSHEDIGYEDYANRLAKGCSRISDVALDFMDKYHDFKYTLEHYWWLKGIEDYEGEDEYKRLKKYFDSGNMELSFPVSGVHTHWHGYEQLPRSTYYSGIYAKKRWGINSRSAVFADISGMSWSAVGAYANAGVKYVMILSNVLFRLATDDPNVPQCFWWVAPNGKDRVLLWRQRGYRHGKLLKSDILHCPIAQHQGYPDADKADPKEKYEICKQLLDAEHIAETEDLIDEIINDLGNVSFDLLPIAYYMDREKPLMMLKAACDVLNEKWAYPKFSLGTPSLCLEYIEKNFGETLPVYAGDLTDQWSDFAVISPEYFSIKRKAEALFSVAESLSTLKYFDSSTSEFPRKRLSESLWRMCEFDEHCWATSIKVPIEMHRFNHCFVKEQSALVALNNIESIISERFCDNVNSHIAALNPIPEDKRVMLKIDGINKTPVNTVCQKMYDGSILTEPVSLPSYGIKSFAAEECKFEENGFAKVTGDVIDTGIYLVKFEKESGKISSIIKKASSRELIDNTCEYSLGDYIYVTTESKTSDKLTFNLQDTTKVSIENGPLAVSIIRNGYEPESCAILCSVITFYKHDEKIDVNLKFKDATTLIGDNSDRYRKNIFYCFPLKVSDYQFITELAGGVVNETKDRIPLHPRDFVVTQNWVAVENQTQGVGLFTREMPVFHLGGIHYNKLSNEFRAKNSNIYLYAASNRSNQLSFAEKENCFGEFNLMILPYEGKWQDTLPEKSIEFMYPPIVKPGYAKERSYLKLDGENIRMTAFKKSENGDGIIARFVETGGEDRKAAINLPFGVKSAVYTNIIEEPMQKEPQLYGSKITFEIGKFSYATILIIPENGFDMADEKEDTAQIKNVFVYKAHNKQNVVCWEKYDYEKSNGYTVYSDGKVIAEVENQPFKVQFYMTGEHGTHSYEIKEI
jgi:hypothetical protein